MFSFGAAVMRNPLGRSVKPLSVGFLMIALATSAAAQSTSKWCGYQLRTPGWIIANEADTETVRTSDFIATADPFPSRVPVRFTGAVRSISDDRRLFLKNYFHFRNLQGSDTLLQHEIQAADRDGDTLWFPIQETMLGDFRSEVAPGDSTTLFLLWAGAFGPKNKVKDWVFLVNEFTSLRSRSYWIDELATCRAQN